MTNNAPTADDRRPTKADTADVGPAVVRSESLPITEVHDTTLWHRLTGFLHPNHSFFQWIILLVVLGLWGAWAGPGWDPQPMPALLAPLSEDTDIETAVPTPELGEYDVEVSDHTLTVPTGDNLQMRLRMPIGGQGEVPGVVLLHGTGTSSHADFVEHGQRLASAGIATLVPDKPLDQYSTVSRNYEQLAQTYFAAAEWLREQPGVSIRDVGYLGESEGALTAPIAAAADPRTAFVILVSDPAIPIRQQGALAADSYLRNIDAPAPILRAVPRLISGAIADGDFLYANFDPGPYHKQLTMPVLMAYGTKDLSMPIVQGPVVVSEQLAEAGNDDFLVRYYDGADHGLRVNGEILYQPFQDMADFINGLPQSVDLSAQIAGAQPRQDYVAQTVDAPRWFGSGTAMLIILAVAFSLTTIANVVALIGQIHYRGEKLINFRGVGSQLVISNIGIIVAWVLLMGYVVLLANLAMSFEANRWVVHGGWLVLQIAGLVAAWRFLKLVHSWRDVPPTSRWAASITVLSLVGQALLLLSLAYWGIFPSIV